MENLKLKDQYSVHPKVHFYKPVISNDTFRLYANNHQQKNYSVLASFPPCKSTPEDNNQTQVSQGLFQNATRK